MGNAVLSAPAAIISPGACGPYKARIPGSKSMTNRALVIAACTPGWTEIVGALRSEDTDHLAAALADFGGIDVRMLPDSYVVHRSDGQLTAPEKPVFVGGAGTPARFLIAFAAAAQGQTTISGNSRLCERPMADLVSALVRLGIETEHLVRPGCLPVRVTGGRITKSYWSVSGAISSQFASALMLLAAQQKSKPIRLRVEGHLVSRPYLEMTAQMLSNLGGEVARDSESSFVITPRPFTAHRIEIEPDASGMSYFLGAAALTGRSVCVEAIGSGSPQGDMKFASLLGQMGCNTNIEARRVTVAGNGGKLRGISIDMESMPDMVLTLAALAVYADGPTHITNIANLRVKECDRIHAAATELQRLGVDATESDDAILIAPGAALRPACIETYNDHRVAMAFGMLGLRHDGIEIENPDCVSKSFPGFWDELSNFKRYCNEAGGENA